MLQLRPMREDEFPTYLGYFIPDYAAEVASSYRLSDVAALDQVKREMASDLPDGVNTTDQILLCLIDPACSPEKLLGYLWYKQDPAKQVAFIMDFYIFPSLQGKGYGKLALTTLEVDLKRQGFQQIKLRVAADNARARHVYDATGFHVTGINMNKSLT
ncbi:MULTISPECIES: GNAT family N-acetyltransferase [Brucella]|uniref:GCN5-related N-acetyltransferase n=6 Tax=Brucella/Ochrobactrum group TaxID=2826938 RepID=A6WXQ9_BRUA4|nr:MULTISPECIES: GNAT family N-acetyltransferase [Brucella]ABS13763.1 GCN5-related N-acetyltransferase [Brucella anthropi ATCC 49188]AIK43258.1 acetyltransferase family protein [Brucella anthropi]KAB2702857.1 GNAT family N-acetyltransferase [Brucella lupini]KAB2723680.1 GNAT family N-acetyltransferase [Brucella anthropi]KAB2733175.1 GNAT family N-acetyltransferase [Brucella anthropi]